MDYFCKHIKRTALTALLLVICATSTSAQTLTGIYEVERGGLWYPDEYQFFEDSTFTYRRANTHGSRKGRGIYTLTADSLILHFQSLPQERYGTYEAVSKPLENEEDRFRILIRSVSTSDMDEANLVRFDLFDETGPQPRVPILTLGQMLPDVSFPSGILPTHISIQAFGSLPLRIPLAEHWGHELELTVRLVIWNWEEDVPAHTERWRILFDDDSGDVRLTTDYKTILLQRKEETP